MQRLLIFLTRKIRENQAIENFIHSAKVLLWMAVELSPHHKIHLHLIRPVSSRIKFGLCPTQRQKEREREEKGFN